MSDISSLFKFVSTSMWDLATGRAETSFFQRNTIKTETYFALAELWSEIDKILKGEPKVVGFQQIYPDFDPAYETFSNSIRETFAKFEYEKDYSRQSAPESLFETTQTYLHKLVANSGETRIEIGNEFKSFWSNFFALKRHEADESTGPDNVYLDEMGIMMSNYFKLNPLRAVVESHADAQASEDYEEALELSHGNLIPSGLAGKLSAEIIEGVHSELISNLQAELESKLTGDMIAELSPIVNLSMRMKLIEELGEHESQVNAVLDTLKSAGVNVPEGENWEEIEAWLEKEETANEIEEAARVNMKVKDDFVNMPVWAEEYGRYVAVAIRKLKFKLELLQLLEKELTGENDGDPETGRSLISRSSDGISKFVAISIANDLAIHLENSLREILIDELGQSQISELEGSYNYVAASLAGQMSQFLHSMVRNPLGVGIIPFIEYVLVEEAHIPAKESDTDGFSVEGFRKDTKNVVVEYAAGGQEGHESLDQFRQLIKNADPEKDGYPQWRLQDMMVPPIEALAVRFRMAIIQSLGMQYFSREIVRKSLLDDQDAGAQMPFHLTREFVESGAREIYDEKQKALVDLLLDFVPQSGDDGGSDHAKAEWVKERLKMDVVERVLKENDPYNCYETEFGEELRHNRFQNYFDRNKLTDESLEKLHTTFIDFAYYLRLIVNFELQKSEEYGEDEKAKLNELVEEIRKGFQARVKEDIKISMYNVILRHFPQATFSDADEDELDIESNLETIGGVLLEFERNLREILDRNANFN